MACRRAAIRAACPRPAGSGSRLPTAAACALALASAAAAAPPPPALPVPCIAGSCGPNATNFVAQGTASAVQSGNSLTINQSSNSALLNWKSFNIGANGVVTFDQPSSAALAVNLIFQGDPSRIMGALNANGRIYLLNQNGIIFGSGAQV